MMKHNQSPNTKSEGHVCSCIHSDDLNICFFFKVICFVFQMNSHMCFDLNQVWIYITYYIINSLIKSIIIKKFGKINN